MCLLLRFAFCFSKETAMDLQSKGKKSFWQSKTKRGIFIAAISAVIVLAIAVGACAVYLGDYYKADDGAIEAFAPMKEVEYTTLSDGSIVFTPEKPIAGFIFYPGGKVENDAYKPLMAALADKGILCVLVEMPFNLAILDINAADGIRESYPEVDKWYIGGHSLGGAMAATYLGGHARDFDGLVLLGAYSTVDLSATGLDVLSVYGSEDNVMNREKYDSSIGNLPAGFTETVIEGGCHAYFGMYGSQEGDGVPTVTNEEQIYMTADAIFDLIREDGTDK